MIRKGHVLPRGEKHFGTGGHKPYTPPARTAEDDRCLLNWLSTRVTSDGLDCHPDSTYERTLVENRLGYAQALGLQVRPGAYLAPGSVQLQKTSQQIAFGEFLAQRNRKRSA